MLKICYLSNEPRRIRNYRQILEKMEMIHIAKTITARSCVPDGYKIIDDRNIW